MKKKYSKPRMIEITAEEVFKRMKAEIEAKAKAKKVIRLEIKETARKQEEKIANRLV